MQEVVALMSRFLRKQLVDLTTARHFFFVDISSLRLDCRRRLMRTIRKFRSMVQRRYLVAREYTVRRRRRKRLFELRILNDLLVTPLHVPVNLLIAP
jgi:hypothetical protein